MPEPMRLIVNGMPLTMPHGSVVAAALLQAAAACRISVSGEARAPLCGMGICFECRATINGVAHQRTCEVPCASGMVVETSR